MNGDDEHNVEHLLDPNCYIDGHHRSVNHLKLDLDLHAYCDYPSHGELDDHGQLGLLKQFNVVHHEHRLELLAKIHEKQGFTQNC